MLLLKHRHPPHPHPLLYYVDMSHRPENRGMTSCEIPSLEAASHLAYLAKVGLCKKPFVQCRRQLQTPPHVRHVPEIQQWLLQQLLGFDSTI